MIFCKKRVLFCKGSGCLDNSNFANQFYFTEYTRKTNYHTDQFKGAPFHYFGYIIDGWARFVSDTEDFTVESGELVYIPSHLPYHSYWYGSPEVRFLSIGFGIFPDEAQKRYQLQKVALTEDTRKLLLDIPLKNPVDCDGVSRLYALLHRLLPQMAYKTKKPTDETVVKARKYMEIDPKLSIAEIARNCGLSESGLYAAFRQQGTTPVEFRQRLLCEKAVTLLISTDMTVENVSDTLGFSTPSYFRRVLKKHFGKTPKEIRSNIPI